MRFVDMLQLDAQKLLLELWEKRIELEKLRFQLASGSLKQMHKIKTVKKEIARIKTALAEKKRIAMREHTKPQV